MMAKFRLKGISRLDFTVYVVFSGGPGGNQNRDSDGAVEKKIERKP